MARPVFTHEEHLAAREKLYNKIDNLKRDQRLLKKRVEAAEEKVKGYVFINKKPDYFFSFAGHLILRRFQRLNGLTLTGLELLVVISYVEVFLTEHKNLFKRNWFNLEKVLKILIDQHYVVLVKIPGKTKSAFRNGYVLTQKGKDLEADYERFYDEKIEELKKGKLTRFTFEDGAYFRKVYITRYQRRIDQGGGKLKNRSAVKNEGWEVPDEKT